VRTLYVRVFQEFFSATSLQPIPEDEFEKALEFSMKEFMSEDDKKEIMKLFTDEDEDNTGSLNITQVKNVIKKCIEQNLFTDFFDDVDVNLKKYA
jgi:Ca2+-binding EF-hand superfamily protein